MVFNLLILFAKTLSDLVRRPEFDYSQGLEDSKSLPSPSEIHHVKETTNSPPPLQEEPTRKSLSFRKNLSKSYFIFDGKLPTSQSSETSKSSDKEREDGPGQEQIETQDSSTKFPSEEIEEIEESEETEEEEDIEEISLYNGLPNFGNTCFANSLVQSLYHIESFREGIIQAYHDRSHINPLLGNSRSVYWLNFLQDLLAELFIAMKTGSNNKGVVYRKFLNKMFYLRNEFKIGVQGDSSALFRALVEELCNERDIQQIPYLKIFTGEDLNITKKCPNCEAERSIKENIRPLEVMDINFLKENSRRFFKMANELRRCAECKKREQMKCCYTIKECPEILAVRIQDTQGSRGTVEILESFVIFEGMNKKKKKVEYKFVAGVLNTSKGERGHHSVEVSQIDGKWYQISDEYCRKISYGCMNYHPKILFYQRSSSSC